MEANHVNNEGVWERFSRWRREERTHEASLSNTIFYGLLSLVTDPVLFVVLFGPILIQLILQIVAPQLADVPDSIRVLLRDPKVCGITIFTLTLYTAFLAWAIFLGGLAKENLVILKDHWRTLDRMPGRKIRLIILIIMFIAMFFFGLHTFFLGGAATDLMAYQFGHCYQPGRPFEVPPLGSNLTWLRILIVASQLAILLLHLSPNRWNLDRKPH